MFSAVLLVLARLVHATVGSAVRSVGISDESGTSTTLLLVITEALLVAAVLQFVVSLTRRRSSVRRT